MKRRHFDGILAKKRPANQVQLTAAFEEQQGEPRIGDCLVNQECITEKQRLEILGQQLELEVVSLADWPFQPEVVELIPRKMAVRYRAIALSRDMYNLKVAMDDPLDLPAQQDIYLVTGMALKLVLAERQEIDYAIELQYSQIESYRSALSEGSDLPESQTGGLFSIEKSEELTPAVNLLNSLLITGYNTNVSDIHIQPYELEAKIYIRKDGMLLYYMSVSLTLYKSLLTRVKIVSCLDIAERRKPQDGHFSMKMSGTDLHVRVSCIPTIHGEKGVLRLLNSRTHIDLAGQFGMNQENYAKLCRMLCAPSGLLYLTGPTGCGKTTTLYFILEHLKQSPVNITTIEDPVERMVEGVSQIQVNEKAGVTFESGLRAMLRQDPDILMIGETRDFETASISARASMTGHLVLSTLHTSNALSAVGRLRDMGISSYLIADTLLGLAAQRLLRKICVYCHGRGCHMCGETGYRGRIAIHQIVEIDDALRNMIAEERPVRDMEQYAADHLNLTSLEAEGLGLVEEGITTMDEIRRMFGASGKK